MQGVGGTKLSGGFHLARRQGRGLRSHQLRRHPIRQTFIAAHECCHYLKDRREGPVNLKGKLEYKRQ